MSDVRTARIPITEHVRVWAVLGGDVLYSEKFSRQDADALLERDRHLIEKFGPPKVEARVVALSPIFHLREPRRA